MRNERVKMGLTLDSIEEQEPENLPGLGFVKSPKFNCRSELNLHRKKI